MRLHVGWAINRIHTARAMVVLGLALVQYGVGRLAALA